MISLLFKCLVFAFYDHYLTFAGMPALDRDRNMEKLRKKLDHSSIGLAALRLGFNGCTIHPFFTTQYLIL